MDDKRNERNEKFNNLPTYVSVKEFAEYLGVGLTLVYQYTRAKGFPVLQRVKRGRVLIDLEAALDWLQDTTLYSRPQYYEPGGKW